jgi:hypothetical protein
VIAVTPRVIAIEMAVGGVENGKAAVRHSGAVFECPASERPSLRNQRCK